MFCFQWCCPPRVERVDGGRGDRRRRPNRSLRDDSLEGDAPQDDLVKPQITANEIAVLDRIQQKLEERAVEAPTTSADPLSDLKATIDQLMESLDSEAMRYDAIISALLVEGRRQRKRGKKEIHEFVRMSASSLAETQQIELKALLADLPGAVLGDEEEKESTRVLIDLVSDIRQSITDVRHFHHNTDGVKAVAEKLEHALQNDAFLLDLVSELMGSVSEDTRFRIVLVQLLLSHLVPANRDDRAILFAYLFKKIPPS